MPLLLKYVIVCLAGYLLGSFSPSIFLSRRIAGKDIRTMGSGNAGSTNTYRNLGPAVAVAVLAIDLLKGVLAALIGRLVLGELCWADGLYGGFAAGLGAILGHAFPVYYGFRGGKGVVTAAGMLLVFDWRIIALMVGVFLLFAVLTRYVSLGSVMAAAALPVLTALFYPKQPGLFLGALCVALLVIWLHRGNIARLCKRSESRFYFKKKS